MGLFELGGNSEIGRIRKRIHGPVQPSSSPEIGRSVIWRAEPIEPTPHLEEKVYSTYKSVETGEAAIKAFGIRKSGPGYRVQVGEVRGHSIEHIQESVPDGALEALSVLDGKDEAAAGLAFGRLGRGSRLALEVLGLVELDNRSEKASVRLTQRGRDMAALASTAETATPKHLDESSHGPDIEKGLIAALGGCSQRGTVSPRTPNDGPGSGSLLHRVAPSAGLGGPGGVR